MRGEQAAGTEAEGAPAAGSAPQDAGAKDADRPKPEKKRKAVTLPSREELIDDALLGSRPSPMPVRRFDLAARPQNIFAPVAASAATGSCPYIFWCMQLCH